MFQVLLPVDSRDDYGIAAADATCSLPNVAETVEVTILNVQPDIDAVSDEGRVHSREWFDESDLPSSVTKVREQLESAGISVTVRREHADPVKKIVETADEIGADRIIMSGRKRTPTGKVLFGSVTQSVLLESSVPVTVVMK